MNVDGIDNTKRGEKLDNIEQKVIFLKRKFILFHLITVVILCGGTLVVQKFFVKNEIALPVFYGAVMSVVNMIILSELVLSVLTKKNLRAQIFFLLKILVFFLVVVVFYRIRDPFFLIGHLSFFIPALIVERIRRSLPIQ